MAPGADLRTLAPQARIPKLKYRNPLPADDIALAQGPPRYTEARTVGTLAPPTTSSSTASRSDYRPSYDTASLAPPSQASTNSSAGSSNDSRTSKKKRKKASSVLGFLTLKEPSQVALEQYAEAQRKHAAERGGASISSGPSINSSVRQKLPNGVPKVNSKWDGVPESVKNRYSGSQKSTKNRHSMTSQDPQFTASWDTSGFSVASRLSVMTDGTRNPPNSIASEAASMSNLTIREGTGSTTDLPGTAEFSETLYYAPEPLAASAARAEPSRPGTYRRAGAEASLESTGLPFGPSFLAVEYIEPRPDSPASSTDSDDTVVRDTADVIFKKLNDKPHKSLWGDAPAVQSLDRQVPESHDFLFGDPSAPDISTVAEVATPLSIPLYHPAHPVQNSGQVQNFSRPMVSSGYTAPKRPVSAYRTTPRSTALPTLYEASITSIGSTESLDTAQDNDNADAYSIAPSTIAPSVLSARWHGSPRERLGLGGRLRKNDVSPWDVQRDLPGKPKKNRFSVFSRT
jgi:hypothetical protein